MQNLKFNLLENAIDSLKMSVNMALVVDKNPSNLKVVILLVTQSVELILKERLKQEHWSLIYRNVDHAGNEDAYTVSINETIKRLKSIAYVELKESEINHIKHLQKIRNNIQHFKFEIPRELAISLIQDAIVFLIHFLFTELNTDIKSHLSIEEHDLLMNVEKTLIGLQKNSQQEIDKLRNKYQPPKPEELSDWHFEVIECPLCWEDYYVISTCESISECKLCGYKGGFVTCARCGNSFPSHSSDLQFEEEDGNGVCGTCWAQTMAEP
jgi:hypothetical protein